MKNNDKTTSRPSGIEWRSITPCRSRCQEDGNIRHTTEVEEGLVVWPVQ